MLQQRSPNWDHVDPQLISIASLLQVSLTFRLPFSTAQSWVYRLTCLTVLNHRLHCHFWHSRKNLSFDWVLALLWQAHKGILGLIPFCMILNHLCSTLVNPSFHDKLMTLLSIPSLLPISISLVAALVFNRDLPVSALYTQWYMDRETWFHPHVPFSFVCILLARLYCHTLAMASVSINFRGISSALMVWCLIMKLPHTRKCPTSFLQEALWVFACQPKSCQIFFWSCRRWYIFVDVDIINMCWCCFPNQFILWQHRSHY